MSVCFVIVLKRLLISEQNRLDGAFFPDHVANFQQAEMMGLLSTEKNNRCCNMSFLCCCCCQPDSYNG
ncbi:hypothetical protein Ciccas_013670 [Cichlidogyrus casuarinus]|uniref:Uncharacterized protein n=1 Tax=Cichlidogyrus casuarinus TaxID=1844966 RepID=A0ABD2PPZ6_9PLAT